MAFSEILGLYDTPLCTSIGMGGASPGFSLELAGWSVTSGQCKHVLILAADSGEADVLRPSGPRSALWEQPSAEYYRDYQHPYGPLMASVYALAATRHMHEYGTTEQQLSAVTVAIRFNGSLGSEAPRRVAVRADEVIASPLISSPIRELHCPPSSVGGAALLITTYERAQHLKHRPVLVRGSAGMNTGYYSGGVAAPTSHKPIAQAAAKAFKEADVRPQDCDLVMVDDSCSINPIFLLEDFGFCGRGKGGEFVGDGSRIRVGGEQPVNPHGGQLSFGSAAANYLSYVEAARQLRGDCGPRQVRNARLALASCADGALSAAHLTILEGL